MPKKKIVTIGFEVNDEHTYVEDYNSDISLLDWDIILFKPDIRNYIDTADSYKGKPSLNESMSFRLREKTEHWRREIKDAVDSGKNVFLFLTDLAEIFIDSGQRNYSGTGRNRQTTVIVSEYSNYNCLPLKINPIKTKGSEIKLSPKHGHSLSSYWSSFSEFSSYKVVLTGEKIPATLLTKVGDKPVGAIYRPKDSNGSLVLLPDIEFYRDNFFDEEGEWTEESAWFAKKLIAEIVSLDKSLKGSNEFTAEPEWATNSKYKTIKERKLSEDLLKVESELEKIQLKKERLINEVKDTGRLRNLLFEKGKPLEYAIIEALKILGFKATQYDDGNSEFDAVFESSEGRLIGEAEGKDNKAINIEKLRQLSLNIHEDLEREQVKSPAKAVLFGNPFRLMRPEDRGDPFTDKCKSASSTSSTALVFTPDLFEAAQYLSDNKDARFATRCRKLLLSSIGRVFFPEVPIPKSGSKEEFTEEPNE